MSAAGGGEQPGLVDIIRRFVNEPDLLGGHARVDQGGMRNVVALVGVALLTAAACAAPAPLP